MRKSEKELKVVYEDEDLVVIRAPDDVELERIVVSIIRSRGRPVTWHELRKLSGRSPFKLEKVRFLINSSPPTF